MRAGVANLLAAASGELSLTTGNTMVKLSHFTMELELYFTVEMPRGAAVFSWTSSSGGIVRWLGNDLLVPPKPYDAHVVYFEVKLPTNYVATNVYGTLQPASREYFKIAKRGYANQGTRTHAHAHAPITHAHSRACCSRIAPAYSTVTLEYVCSWGGRAVDGEIMCELLCTKADDEEKKSIIGEKHDAAKRRRGMVAKRDQARAIAAEVNAATDGATRCDQRRRLDQAARDAVRASQLAYKNRRFNVWGGQVAVWCDQCNEVTKYWEVEVDHLDVLFWQLLTYFLDEHVDGWAGLPTAALEERFRALQTQWVGWHDERARLQLLCTACHREKTSVDLGRPAKAAKCE